MSTVIKLIPEAHSTKRTTWIQLTNDGVFRTRVEDPVGSDTDKLFNFSSLSEGEAFTVANEPFVSISAEKIGDNARYIVSVTEFYDEELTGDDIPQQRFIWYDYKTKADEAPDSETVQTWPINVLFSTAGTPQSPTRAFSTASQPLGRFYARLGSLTARREYLKGLLRGIIDHPHFAIWMANVDEDATINSRETGLQTIANLAARPQSFVIWLEMMANVLSIDANLNSERKFNLLEGELKLGGYDVFTKPSSAVYGTTEIRDATRSARTQWEFHRFGDTAATTPWAYTKPTAARWTAHEDTTLITLTTAALGTTWLDWVRE